MYLITSLKSHNVIIHVGYITTPARQVYELRQRLCLLAVIDVQQLASVVRQQVLAMTSSVVTPAN